MMDKKGSFLGVLFLVVLIVAFGFSLYFLYLSFPGDPKDLVEITTQNDQDNLRPQIEYASSEQFYENMRFRDRKITYKVEAACSNEKSQDVDKAFSILESETILDFNRVAGGEAEITIFCSNVEPPAKQDGFFVAGEGGPTEVINTSLYSVILAGKVSFFREERCDEPKIALHEILHVLGFDHNSNPDSILHPTLDCDQTIDESIIRNINELYSTSSKPDLEILELDATKSGRYLNFEVEVINQGLKDAENIYLRIYAEDKFVKEFDLEDLDIGTRKFLEVENLKLPIRKNDEITFVVDEDDIIDELHENNNEITLVVE